MLLRNWGHFFMKGTLTWKGFPMDAKELRSIVSAFPDNATPIIRKGEDYNYLELTASQIIKGKIIFRTGFQCMEFVKKDWEKCPDQFNNMETPDYKEILQKILANKEILPALLGLDDGLDRLIQAALQSGFQTLKK